jgi:hypothetical protein
VIHTILEYAESYQSSWKSTRKFGNVTEFSSPAKSGDPVDPRSSMLAWPRPEARPPSLTFGANFPWRIPGASFLSCEIPLIYIYIYEYQKNPAWLNHCCGNRNRNGLVHSPWSFWGPFVVLLLVFSPADPEKGPGTEVGCVNDSPNRSRGCGEDCNPY